MCRHTCPWLEPSACSCRAAPSSSAAARPCLLRKGRGPVGRQRQVFEAHDRLAVLVGGEPELAETPRVRFVESEAFVLGGVAFEVAHVSRTAGDSPTTRLVLRATDEGVAKAVLDTLEVVTDTGPVTIVRRSWSTMTAPARETTLACASVVCPTARAEGPRQQIRRYPGSLPGRGSAHN